MITKTKQSVPLLILEMLPAGHGDCLLLRYGTVEGQRSVLIDGGPYNCYPALQSRFQKLPDGLQLLIVTHVDADHAEGIVKLLQDPSSNQPIREAWFNGWPQISEQPETLSPVTGEYVSALITRRAIPWNAATSGAAIEALPPAYPVFELDGGLKLTILSPPLSAVRRLRGIWARCVGKEGLAPGCSREAEKHMERSRRFGRNEVLAGVNLDRLSREADHSDDSPANGSSIALLAEFQDKRILLAGDAHPVVLEEAIRTLLTTAKQDRLELDAFKLAHHGSKESTTNALLKLVQCRNYLISTNGSYFGHPDDEAMARVIRYGGPGAVLHFNYRSDESRFWNNVELRKRENFRVVYPAANDGLQLSLS